MTMNRREVFLILLGGASLATAHAHAQTNGITVSGAWSRATPSISSPGVVYLSVTDTGAPDTLTGVATPVASSAGLHESKVANGMAEMRPVAKLPVTSTQPLHLRPGGYHIMLTGLKKKLSTGDSFPLTLTFAHAGQITTTVAVRSLRGGPPGAMGGAMSHSMKTGGMDMGNMKH